jgi:hypothetical protein
MSFSVLTSRSSIGQLQPIFPQGPPDLPVASVLLFARLSLQPSRMLPLLLHFAHHRTRCPTGRSSPHGSPPIPPPMPHRSCVDSHPSGRAFTAFGPRVSARVRDSGDSAQLIPFHKIVIALLSRISIPLAMLLVNSVIVFPRTILISKVSSLIGGREPEVRTVARLVHEGKLRTAG